MLPHLGAAYNLARWLLRDEQHAHDVVQEAYLRAFRFFAGLRGQSARPWLLGIVRNACYDWMRQNKAFAAELEFDEERDSLAAPASDDPAALWEQRAQRGRVNAAIEALAPPFREVIVLRELEEMSYEEIAQVAGIPIGTVMSRLSRARAALRVALQDEAANSNIGRKRDANA
jgi:RNA polymerase sigma-70 factor (ECF subfamily)